ncbi:MAG: hypothetical protein JW939_02190 [Candidatus Thermoplasmatota archaeon]|nr:hypothetical protein [Candidatus Thermoplasmatota archaeon]
MIEEEGKKEQEKGENPNGEEEFPEENEKKLDKGPEVFDEDEKNLLDELMHKIENAGNIEKELKDDLESFEERMDSVIDSVNRIENLEKAPIKGRPSIEAEQEPDNSDLPLVREEKGALPVEEPDEIPTAETAHHQAEARYPARKDSGLDHIYLPSESPYEQIKKGEIEFDPKGELLDAYGKEVRSVLENMLKLIKIKIDKKDLQKARDLFMLSASIGGTSDFFRREFVPLAGNLNIELPKEKFFKDDRTVTPASMDEMDETKVLDPDLADEIGILQKRASSAIKQLETLVNTSELSDEEVQKIKDQHSKAVDLFMEKRFHKAYEIALETLGSFKDHVADDIDNRLQEDLFHTREMLDEYSRSEGNREPDRTEELWNTLDRATKAYLTNELEKATLLTKKVMNTLLDLKGDAGGPLRERVEELKKGLNSLKEMNVAPQEIEHMFEVIRSAEHLIDRRDIKNAEKIIKSIEDTIEEMKEKNRKYVSARELEIKLKNRIERLASIGPDIEPLRKKMEFIRNYFKDERYDDILLVGVEVEHELDLLEEAEKEKLTRNIIEDMEEVMSRVDELEDPQTYRRNYEEIMKAAEEGDISVLRTRGRDLIDIVNTRLKTIGVERAKRIARAVVEGRMLVSKLRSFEIDTTDLDRKFRKARTLVKEGNHKDGIELMEETTGLMKKAYLEKMEYIKDLTTIYRDSLEVLMDRHKEEPMVYYLKKKQVPVLRKLEELGHFLKALEHYREIGSKFADVIITEEKKESIEIELNKIKYEIYKRKEEGVDISEPLSLYTQAQNRYSEGQAVPAEYLIEVSKRYCDTFIPN